ncbi:MAG: SpoIID/LytB domain-containing protein [Candidatus Omnitrophota bacterium]
MPKFRVIIFFLIALLFFLPLPLSYSQQTNKKGIDASIYYNNGHFSKAAALYKRSGDAGDTEGYLNVAVIFKDLGQYPLAIQVLNKFFSPAGSTDTRLLHLLGRLYYLNNEPDRAIVVLRKLLKQRPKDEETLINLGLCYEDKSDSGTAREFFQKAIAVNNSNVAAHLSLADLYYKKEELSKAIDEYKLVNTFDASITGIQKIIAQILFKLGQTHEALKFYRKVKLVEPANTSVDDIIRQLSAQIDREYLTREVDAQKLKRAKKAVFVKPFPFVKDIVFVRVGLIGRSSHVEFKCSGAFEIIGQDQGVPSGRGAAGKDYTIANDPAGKFVISEGKTQICVIGKSVLLRPFARESTLTLFNVKAGEHNFWSNQKDRSYRGNLEINVESGEISVVNILNLEEYLYSVVPSEMSPSWPPEALKAQAVTARTEALAKLKRHKPEGFDFCPEVHCQAYAGVEQESKATGEAVDQTRGLILKYGGKFIDAVYSSNCGGHTQDNIFNKASAFPYLKGVIDADEPGDAHAVCSPLEMEYWIKEPPVELFCNLSEFSKNSSFRWVRIYGASELSRLVNMTADVGNINKILVLKRQQSGHVGSVEIIGDKKSLRVDKEYNIRKILGNLRGSMFKIEIKYDADKKPAQFIFYGGGWGHGVGMCQSGACGMAKRGKGYKEILRHYFQGTELSQMY